MTAPLVDTQDEQRKRIASIISYQLFENDQPISYEDARKMGKKLINELLELAVVEARIDENETFDERLLETMKDLDVPEDLLHDTSNPRWYAGHTAKARILALQSQSTEPYGAEEVK